MQLVWKFGGVHQGKQKGYSDTPSVTRWPWTCGIVGSSWCGVGARRIRSALEGAAGRWFWWETDHVRVWAGLLIIDTSGVVHRGDPVQGGGGWQGVQSRGQGSCFGGRSAGQGRDVGVVLFYLQVCLKCGVIGRASRGGTQVGVFGTLKEVRFRDNSAASIQNKRDVLSPRIVQAQSLTLCRRERDGIVSCSGFIHAREQLRECTVDSRF